MTNYPEVGAGPRPSAASLPSRDFMGPGPFQCSFDPNYNLSFKSTETRLGEYRKIATIIGLFIIVKRRVEIRIGNNIRCRSSENATQCRIVLVACGRLGSRRTAQFVGQQDGLSDVLHGFAALPALALQGEVSLFFGEFQIALQNALGTFHHFA
jgi:hypothetical protein